MIRVDENIWKLAYKDYHIVESQSSRRETFHVIIDSLSLRPSALSARLKENNMTENEVSYEVRGASL